MVILLEKTVQYMLKIKEAKEELEKKSYRDIQEETAIKWSSRAGASYQNVLSASRDQKFPTYLLAQEYEHEGYEHAALVETGATSLLSRLQAELVPLAAKAWEHLRSEFGI